MDLVDQHVGGQNLVQICGLELVRLRELGPLMSAQPILPLVAGLHLFVDGIVVQRVHQTVLGIVGCPSDAALCVFCEAVINELTFGNAFVNSSCVQDVRHSSNNQSDLISVVTGNSWISEDVEIAAVASERIPSLDLARQK